MDLEKELARDKECKEPITDAQIRSNENLLRWWQKTEWGKGTLECVKKCALVIQGNWMKGRSQR